MLGTGAPACARLLLPLRSSRHGQQAWLPLAAWWPGLLMLRWGLSWGWR